MNGDPFPCPLNSEHYTLVEFPLSVGTRVVQQNAPAGAWMDGVQSAKRGGVMIL